MSAATILFMDIVGFSKKPTLEQRKLVNLLTVEVLHEIRHLLSPPMRQPTVLALPTGDGMALAFLHGPIKDWDGSTILGLILRLHKWAYAETQEGGDVRLRVGVHVGPVELITDINGKPNVCGDTINYAQRVMDAANQRQTLFSEEAFREYVGIDRPILTVAPFSEQLQGEFKGPIEVFAKHGLEVPVYRLTFLPRQEWASDDDPVAKHLTMVSLADPQKPIHGSFAERLEKARHIALIQLSGGRLLESLRDQSVKLPEGLQRLWVFMPNPETCEHPELSLLSSEGQPITATYVRNHIENWKAYLLDVKKAVPRADLKLGIVQGPMPFAASFVDWERQEGRIHISPYVWGFPTSRSPGFELQWLGSRPSDVYETYVEALRYLHSKTVNLIGE